MGSTIQPLRTCLRACVRAPAPRRTLATAPPSTRIRSHLRSQLQAAPRREFTTTPRRASIEDEEALLDDNEPITEQDEKSFEKLEQMWDKMSPADRRNMDKMISSAESGARAAAAPAKIIQRKAFWNEEEDDSDMITDEQDEDTFEEDDILEGAMGKFEEYREYRHYARLAAWEMPLLSKLARPFEPPSADQPLRFRYTTYMGEYHPAENKVVVEFCPKDLPITEAQQLKMKKLLGVRYNPETEIAKISCEQFEHQAQNKRYLGDLIDTLMKEAQDPTDMFEDIPLDTRHHKFKKKPKFPKEWRMTEERRKQLDAARQQAQITDKAREEDGTLVDGPARIQQFLGGPPPNLQSPPQAVPAPVRVGRF